MSYQGHLPGSGVQVHSAGPAYPFIVAVVETDGDKRTRRYQVSGPGLSSANIVLEFADEREADGVAGRLAVLIENEDAWAFEIERALKIGDVRLMSLVSALRAWVPAVTGGRTAFADLTPAERVEVLLWLGNRRRTMLGGRPGDLPPFSQCIAAAMRGAR